MIFNAQAHDDLHRLIRHIENQINTGSTLDEAIEKLRTISTTDNQKIDFLASLLKGDSGDQLQLSPYKIGSYHTLVSLVNLLASSEANIKGSLKALNQCLTVNRNNANKLWKGIKGLAIYLVVILSLTFICTSIYTIKVLPQFQDMFESMGGALPDFTILVMGLSEFLMNWWFLIMPLFLLLIYQLFRLGTKISSLEPLNKAVTFIPGLKNLYKLHFKYLLICYSRILISGGMQSKRALNEALELLNKDATSHSFDALKKDNSLGDISIAYEIGTITSEIEYQFENIEYEYLNELTRIREKITLFCQLTLALIVGSIVIAMYLPIFQMGQVV